MKKIKIVLVLFTFVFSMFTGTAFAAKKDIGGGDVGGVVTAQGRSVPSSDNVWKLDSPYNFSYSFSTSIYSNYCFKPTNGAITINLSSTYSSWNASSDYMTITLYKKGWGSSNCGGYSVVRNGDDSVSWTGLDNNSIYYFYISKANDTVQITGTGEVFNPY